MQIKTTLLVHSKPGVIAKIVMALAGCGFKALKQKSVQADDPGQSMLHLEIEGNGDTNTLKETLLNLDFVKTILSFGALGENNTPSNSQNSQPVDVKEKCKKIMIDFFGPDAANGLDLLSDEECIKKCRTKVKGLIGESSAKIFDTL